MTINDTYFIEAHLDNKTKFERIKYALTIFDFEDELVIKFKDKNLKTEALAFA